MAKDGTNRGGRRVRAGGKPQPLAEKITAGKAARMLESPELHPESLLEAGELDGAAALAKLNSLMGGVEDVKDDDFDLSAALEEAAFVLPGDVWTLGRHRLICGDATNADTVKKLMDGRKANLVLTDPPYGVSFKSADGLKIQNDNLKAEQFYNFLFSAFKCFYENHADGGAFYCFHSDSEKVNFFRACVDAGFHYSTTCIWVKNALVLGRGDYQQMHEPVLYAFKNTAKHK